MFEKLINWSLSRNYDLPWRLNRTLYSTLVSEIMLQQTTVQTVLNHYEHFLKKYPSIDSLAQASEEELTIQWKGLGYYRRARNLRSACIAIMKNHSGKIPLDYDELIKIKGIGEYTANALLAIGANQRALAIDANLERVLSRIYNIPDLKGLKLQRKITKLFNENKICHNMGTLGARNLNEALMDLGRIYCKANNVFCDLCPMKESCLAHKHKIELKLPTKESSVKKEKEVLKLLRVIVEDNNKFFVYKKKSNEWLSLQNELPTYFISGTSETKQYPKLKLDLEFDLLPMIKTAITKYAIENYIIIMNKAEFETLGSNRKYFCVSFSDESNLSTASIKALQFFDFKKQERR